MEENIVSSADAAKAILEEAGELVSAAYEETPGGIIWHKPVKGGTVETQLTNFTARILRDVAEDDGMERRIHYEVEANLRGRDVRFYVPASSFHSLNWAAEHLGASAIVFPGISNKDHARAAIQILSGDVPRETVYAHLGWREVNGEWVYLHAGGAVGASGERPGVAVKVSADLNRFILPAPPEEQEQVKAIHASLRLLDIAPDTITVPILAATYRAPLGNAGLTVHESGKTGQGKTAIAELAQQHYGPGMGEGNLPSAWSSTGNSLEALAFQAKDALLVVDDFAPAGDKYAADRLHREAERFLRAQRNRSGRQRMRPDGTVVPAKPPRGLVLSTGEDIPRGQSLRAGMFVVEVGEGDVDWAKLTEAQKDAASGLYASAMSGYVRCLAPRYESLKKGLREEIARLRDEFTGTGQHRRTPQNVANLALGIRYFLKYAQDAGAISEREAVELWTRCWQALKEAGAAQAHHDQDSDPVYRFLDCLQAAIASGEAYVSDAEGNAPSGAKTWGWRKVTVGTGDFTREEWRPQGRQIGWTDGVNLYLQPDAAFGAAQRMTREGGEGLAINPTTLWKRLSERGLLASREPSQGTLRVRKTLQGRVRRVLHLHVASLFHEKPVKPLESADEGNGDSQETRPHQQQLTGFMDGFSVDGQRPVEESCQRNSESTLSSGPVDGNDRVCEQVTPTGAEDADDDMTEEYL